MLPLGGSGRQPGRRVSPTVLLLVEGLPAGPGPPLEGEASAPQSAPRSPQHEGRQSRMPAPRRVPGLGRCVKFLNVDSVQTSHVGGPHTNLGLQVMLEGLLRAQQ